MNDSTSDIVRPGEHAARFAAGCFVFGVFSELLSCRVRVCDLLLCVFGKERRPRILIRGNCLRFAFVLTWKKTQTTHPHTRELSAIFHCPYLKKNTDHTDAGVPPAATRRSRLTASCCRSRFGVALKIGQAPIAAPKRLRSRSPKATATSCASEASICVICGFSESIRRGCISVIQISTETIRKRK